MIASSSLPLPRVMKMKTKIKKWDLIILRRFCTAKKKPKYSVCVSHSVVSDSLQPHGVLPARLLHLCDFLGKNTGVGCHFLLQKETVNKTNGQSSELEKMIENEIDDKKINLQSVYVVHTAYYEKNK